MNTQETTDYEALRERALKDSRIKSWVNRELFLAVEEKLQRIGQAARLGAGEHDGDRFSILGLDDFEASFRVNIQFKPEAGRTDKSFDDGAAITHRYKIAAEFEKGKLKCYTATDLDNPKQRRFAILPNQGTTDFPTPGGAGSDIG